MKETIEKVSKVLELAKAINSMDLPEGMDITLSVDNCDPEYIRQYAKDNFLTVGVRNEGKIFVKSFYSYFIRLHLWE